MSALDEEIDGLYGLPPDQFTPTRDALAKRLRSEKRREEADAVKRLRRPTLAAWAANQVLRTQRDDARRLFAAADALTAGPADPAAFRTASGDLRASVERLVLAAAGLLTERGELTVSTLEKVRETLRTAVTDPDLRSVAEAGRLERELVGGGFAGLAPSSAAAAPPKRSGRTEPEPEDEPEDPGADSDEDAEAVAVREREEAVAEARRAEAAARATLERAREQREQAQSVLEDARRALEQAEEALEDVQVREARAVADHAEAARALRRLERSA